ncbi:hypothetical protein JG688_00000229 [Phytophthora aleatoria]|uniref:Uncharacterized protein n=1 Tax=Phytophthora aleatoria TaxID=2496075 RepID=A0A8J5J935_9STRA|nr:hypothetical protein JG688_00000229 [Phytophthora aleatoria]
MRRTRVCEVCSLLKDTDDARGGDSSTYCNKCKLQLPRKTLRHGVYSSARKASQPIYGIRPALAPALSGGKTRAIARVIKRMKWLTMKKELR